MQRVSKVLFIAAASLAFTGTAFAQDPPADPPAEGDPATDPAATDPAATPPMTDPAAAPMTSDVPASYTKENWPTAQIDRPLNAAAGMIEIVPEFQLDYTAGDDAAMTDSETATQLNIGARYGISDKLEALFAFDRIIISPSPEEGGDRIKGALTIGAGYGLMQNAAGGKLDGEVKAAFQYDLLAETGFLLAGIDARYKLSPKMWLGTPINRPGLILTVKGAELAPGAGDFTPHFLNIPFAFGFQATPMLHLQVNTDLLRWNINEDAQLFAGLEAGELGEKKTVTLIGADVTPLDLDIIYGLSSALDIRANVDFGDLSNAGDFFGFSVGVAARL